MRQSALPLAVTASRGAGLRTLPDQYSGHACWSVGHFGYGSFLTTGCGFEPAGDVHEYTDALKEG